PTLIVVFLLKNALMSGLKVLTKLLGTSFAAILLTAGPGPANTTLVSDFAIAPDAETSAITTTAAPIPTRLPIRRTKSPLGRESDQTITKWKQFVQKLVVLSSAAMNALNTDSADIVARALAEDLGAGDVTTAATVPAETRARAVIRQKAPGVVYGLDVAEQVF